MEKISLVYWIFYIVFNGKIYVSADTDPCTQAINIGSTWRYSNNSVSNNRPSNCDVGRIENGQWYTFEVYHGDRVSEVCVPDFKCNTFNTVYLKGTHPTMANPGPIDAKVCVNDGSSCCSESLTIQVKLCVVEGRVSYVYKLKKFKYCETGFCVENVPLWACSTEQTWDKNTSQCIDNPCIESPCKNGGLCVNDSSTQRYICYCPDGYTGDICDTTITTPCSANPCNQGTCILHDNSYKCQCKPMFTGMNCESSVIEENRCGSNPCKNGGSCVSQGNDIHCVCPSSYTGSDCSTDIPEKVVNDSGSTGQQNHNTIIIVLGTVVGLLVTSAIIGFIIWVIRHKHKPDNKKMETQHARSNNYTEQTGTNLNDIVEYNEIDDTKVKISENKTEYVNCTNAEHNEDRHNITDQGIYVYDNSPEIQEKNEDKQYSSLTGPRCESEYQELQNNI